MTQCDRNIEQRLFAYAFFSFSDALVLNTLYIFIIPLRHPIHFIYLVASTDSLRHSSAASLSALIDSADFAFILQVGQPAPGS
jgi:hypothetical protein